MIVVLFLCGWKVEIREGDFARMAGSEIVESLTDDGVVVQLDFMTVFEDEGGGRLRRIGDRIGRGGIGDIVSRRNRLGAGSTGRGRT